MSEEVVGHNTYMNDDGTFRHEPLTKSEADALWEHVEAEDKRREELIPDQKTALQLMHDCCTRLREFGWSEPPRYTTKQGVYKFKVICWGSTGVIDVTCNVGSKGSFEWWHHSHGDTWPITPLMVMDVSYASSS